jgi:hypothetical protein
MKNIDIIGKTKVVAMQGGAAGDITFRVTMRRQ